MDKYVEKIIQNPLFLRLKEVVENNAYHDHEDVYSHVTEVKDTALREINADFIINPKAKKLFLQFIDEEFYGMKRNDTLILIALLHDIGKILIVEEAHETHPLLVTSSEGITSCPGHEYWGSTVINEVLKDLSLSKEIVSFIASVIKLHDTFNPEYFKNKQDWVWDTLINDVKSRAEGFYIEALFNIYCDCFNAAPFHATKEIIIKIFNEPKLYERREYVLP